MRRVCAHAGIDGGAEIALGREPLSRQSDDLSESWVQNYLEDVSRR